MPTTHHSALAVCVLTLAAWHCGGTQLHLTCWNQAPVPPLFGILRALGLPSLLAVFAARFMEFKLRAPGVSAPGSVCPEAKKPDQDNDVGLPERCLKASGCRLYAALGFLIESPELLQAQSSLQGVCNHPLSCFLTGWMFQPRLLTRKHLFCATLSLALYHLTCQI